ncbi:DUF5984 family protein [Streptomyces sp. NPDC088846]|uniref:DUF5984 family protein n=1 Tax=Streptomyces sp. NPDC088846 TaxID=3365908 RepID=UPI00381EAD92
MINFRFGLLPVEEIQPWGGVGESPRLSWFGLTDGWYCVDVGGHELLRYDDSGRKISKRYSAADLQARCF